MGADVQEVRSYGIVVVREDINHYGKGVCRMLRKLTLAIGIFAVCILASGAEPFKRTDEITDLKWPMSFSLEAGERATYGFPVMQAGEAAAVVTLRSGTIKVQLLDPAGQDAAKPAMIGAPSGRLSQMIGPQELQKGIIWIAVLENPTRSKVEGQITVTYPAVNSSTLASALTALRTKRQSNLRPDEIQPVSRSGSKAAEKAPLSIRKADKAMEDRRTKLKADLMKRFASASVEGQPTAAVKSVKRLQPTSAVKPMKGLQPASDVKIGKRLQPASDVMPAANVPKPTGDAVLMPDFVIDSVTPDSAIPGTRVEVEIVGSGFAGGSEVHLIVSGNDYLLHSRTVYDAESKTTSLVASLAFVDCLLKQNTKSALYVTGKTRNGKSGKNSAPVDFMALQNVPVILSLDRTEGYAGEHVLVSGRGFLDPNRSVHLKPCGRTIDELKRLSDPSANTSQGTLSAIPGCDYYLVRGEQGTSSQVLFKIPDNFPVPAEGLDLAISLMSYVSNGNKNIESEAVRFHLNPVFEERSAHAWMYPVACADFKKCEDNDVWGEYRPRGGPEYGSGYNGAEHHSGTWSGHKGDDIWEVQRSLANGWVCERVDLERKGSSCSVPGAHTGCNLVSSYVNDKGYPAAKIHWFVEYSCDMTYSIDFILKGPAGIRSY